MTLQTRLTTFTFIFFRKAVKRHRVERMLNARITLQHSLRDPDLVALGNRSL